jgi:DNA-binding IclR family transcriptional regulator
MKPATTVTKVCRILGEFRNRPSLGVTDLARSLKLCPSDVHRILNSLLLYGYVEQSPETRRYHLGAGSIRLGLSALQRNVVREKGHGILLRLSSRLDAATHLALFDIGQCEVFLVDQVDPENLSVFESRPGATPEMHSTALGKTVMAGMDTETFQRSLVRCGLTKSTRKTITEQPALEKELQLIRQRGYAIDREESAEGSCCVGSPVRNCSGSVIGAISASMKANRFESINQIRLVSLVDNAAAELSSLLGYDSGETSAWSSRAG